jgi:hypothetical protein
MREAYTQAEGNELREQVCFRLRGGRRVFEGVRTEASTESRYLLHTRLPRCVTVGAFLPTSSATLLSQRRCCFSQCLRCCFSQCLRCFPSQPACLRRCFTMPAELLSPCLRRLQSHFACGTALTVKSNAAGTAKVAPQARWKESAAGAVKAAPQAVCEGKRRRHCDKQRRHGESSSADEVGSKAPHTVTAVPQVMRD